MGLTRYILRGAAAKASCDRHCDKTHNIWTHYISHSQNPVEYKISWHDMFEWVSFIFSMIFSIRVADSLMEDNHIIVAEAIQNPCEDSTVIQPCNSPEFLVSYTPSSYGWVNDLCEECWCLSRPVLDITSCCIWCCWLKEGEPIGKPVKGLQTWHINGYHALMEREVDELPHSINTISTVRGNMNLAMNHKCHSCCVKFWRQHGKYENRDAAQTC